MTGRTILMTNVWLDRRGGTETVIRDLSLGLLRRGWRPVIYSPLLGEPAGEIAERGVPVISNLAQMAEPPDLIHGQHFIQTGEAILAFPDRPAVQMCHSALFWQEGPAKLPQIATYVAVDEAVRDRLAHQEAIDPARVEIVRNAVDLTRIPPRPAPLPERPRRALAFTKHSAQLPLIEAACRRHGVQLEVLGMGVNRTVGHPEAELVNYDLVFATARMALEAICAGCAVVVCDSRGLAGLATCANLDRMRALNFGLRALTRPVRVETLAEAIAAYDAADATRLSAALRADADLEKALDRLEAIYARAADAPPPSSEEIRQGVLAFLTRALPRARGDARWPWMAEREALMGRIQQLEGELAAARTALHSPRQGG